MNSVQYITDTWMDRSNTRIDKNSSTCLDFTSQPQTLGFTNPRGIFRTVFSIASSINNVEKYLGNQCYLTGV
jgi:hypothetical protein